MGGDDMEWYKIKQMGAGKKKINPEEIQRRAEKT